ncbi:MAG: ABC transporter substrate-binding protein [Rhodospirillales bacterium]|nr:ABC transporter substrate-binding protein [Rhodospirillales bacterium]
MPVLGRRAVVKGAVALAAAPAVVRTAAAAEKATLCSLYALSGTFAAAGKPSVMGAQIATRVLGKAYGLDIDYVSVDSEGNPGRAVAKALAEIQQNRHRLFFGAVLSSVALALSAEVNKAGGVFVTAVGADEVTGTNCNRATFRWSVPTYGAIQQTVRPLIETYPDAKRWYTITPKYVFGESLLQNAQALFKEKGIEHVGNSYHSLTETEFSGYLTNAAAAKPDVLLLLNFGAQSTNTLRQAADFGMKQKMKILMVWAAGLEQYQEIGTDVLDGVYVGCQYDMAIDSPGNRKILDIYSREASMPPSYTSISGYICSDLIMRGIRKSGSADPAAIIRALEGLQYEGPTGDETIQAFDHQVVKNYYLLQGKPKAKMRSQYDYVDIVSFGRSFLTQAQSACHMT